MADEHRTAHLTAQVQEAGNDVQAAISRLLEVPAETPAGSGEHPFKDYEICFVRAQ